MKEKIYIVGAGISGLIAALNLEKAGFNPVIYEASDSPGGRIKTDIIEGYQLDHGFQVLLDAYPKAMEYFDYDKLKLRKILPGAILFNEGKTTTLGDPSRHLPFLWPTLVSGVANLRDIYLLWSLHRSVQQQTDKEIFCSEEMPTIEFLSRMGFSNRIIHKFFKPFFTGIFLETELETSCRMFQFVFKMFGRGYATIPEGGMGALAGQLIERLQRTTIHYNTPVAVLEEGKLTLADGSSVPADGILVAASSSDLLPGDSGAVLWLSCDTLYFETEVRTIKKPIIGLITESDSLINNIFYPTSISNIQKGASELLSVTVVKRHKLKETELISRVTDELNRICGIENPRFIKRYNIAKALPALDSLSTEWTEKKGRSGANIYIAGDHLLYGSTNAAIISGERAARAMIDNLEVQA
ncbi:NAD(P)/FAD-dependent oxidoreductase [Muriicola sp. E247]|uniref:NAD(P)/FAD-dependent oxidoreductase n=1 Tax=Muriicola sp. E247 TaxID=3242730 RepID=UPI0035269DA9